MNLPLITFVTAAVITQITARCPNGCNLPITVYNDLKCVPNYSQEIDCCPKSYDCSHIYGGKKDTCHFKGKTYKVGDKIEDGDVKGTCDRQCTCASGPKGLAFSCPLLMDGCAEFWVSGYPAPGCYLRHEPNECCSQGEICPPFDASVECKVNEKTYKEGERFEDPVKSCSRCVCKKGALHCEENECNVEIKNSPAIDSYCAPFYSSGESCCPNRWICKKSKGKFLKPLASSDPLNDNPKCKFGDATVEIGNKYEEDGEEGKIHCECLVPPLMSCGPQPFNP